MKLKVFIGLTVFALAACQANTPTNQTTKTNASVAVNAAPDRAKIKTYDGTGVVTKINTKLGSVELNHEEIKGAMPAMQMEFYVSDKKMLDNLNVGDKVDFVLEDNAGAERIISIKKNQGK